MQHYFKVIPFIFLVFFSCSTTINQSATITVYNSTSGTIKASVAGSTKEISKGYSETFDVDWTYTFPQSSTHDVNVRVKFSNNDSEVYSLTVSNGNSKSLTVTDN